MRGGVLLPHMVCVTLEVDFPDSVQATSLTDVGLEIDFKCFLIFLGGEIFFNEVGHQLVPSKESATFSAFFIFVNSAERVARFIDANDSFDIRHFEIPLFRVFDDCSLLHSIYPGVLGITNLF